MTSLTKQRLQVALPQQWRVHDPSSWRDLSGVGTVNPALRLAISDLDTGATHPNLIASLNHEIDVEENGTRTVLLASLVIFVLPMDGHITSIPIEGHVRREVRIVDDIRADFLQLPVVVADKQNELVALATFTTPNLPLAADMTKGFAAIAKTIRFVPFDAAGTEER